MGTTERLVLSSLLAILFFRYLYTSIKSLLEPPFLQAGETQLSQSPLVCVKCFNPLIIFVFFAGPTPVCSGLSLSLGLELVPQVHLSRAGQRERIYSLNLLPMLFLKQAR